MAFMVGADVPTGGSENGPLRHVSYRNPTKMTPTILPEILSRFPQGSRHPPLYPARAHDTNYSVTGFSFPAGKSSSTALSCAGSRHQPQRHRLLLSSIITSPTPPPSPPSCCVYLDLSLIFRLFLFKRLTRFLCHLARIFQGKGSV